MKIFIDTANIDQIREANELGVIDGVTTNPTLVAMEKRPFRELVKEICEIVDGPISAEAISMDHQEMVKEAQELASIHHNIVVKIPLTAEGLKATKICTQEKDIKVNVTLCFSATQALLAGKAGATYISPFVGRLDDISSVGMDLISEIVTIYENYEDIKTEVLVASVRNPLHVIEAATMGAHVVTIPFKVIMQMLSHPLTDKGIQMFLDDWDKVKDL